MVVNARYLTIDIVNLLYKYDTLNQEKPNLFIYLLNPHSPHRSQHPDQPDRKSVV